MPISNNCGNLKFDIAIIIVMIKPEFLKGRRKITILWYKEGILMATIFGRVSNS